MDFKWSLLESEGRIDCATCWHGVLETLISSLVFLLIFGAGLKLVDVVFLAVFKNPLSLPFDASFRNALLLFVGWNFESLAEITVKRLHDRNKSGWWIVPFFMAPLLLLRPSDWLDNPTLAHLVDALAFGLSVWCLVELCLSGTRGPNRFGPAPVTPRKTTWVERRKDETMPDIAGPPPAWLVKPDHDSASADQCSSQ